MKNSIPLVRQVLLAAGLGACLLGAFCMSAPAEGITEPPVVVYGKVLHIDQGATYQIVDGVISLTLTSENDPANSVNRSGVLRPTGMNDAFSNVCRLYKACLLEYQDRWMTFLSYRNHR